MVLKRILAPAAVTAPNDAFYRETSSTCRSQVSKSEAAREPNTKAPAWCLVFGFPLMRSLLMAGVRE